MGFSHEQIRLSLMMGGGGGGGGGIGAGKLIFVTP